MDFLDRWGWYAALALTAATALAAALIP